MAWSYVGVAHLENWWKFFAGLREEPPEKSGLLRPTSDGGKLYFGTMTTSDCPSEGARQSRLASRTSLEVPDS